MPLTAPPAPTPPLLWDVFCRVIDNFGDIGVCWRLACDLAGRGQRVRLWVDDPSALRWMAPQGHAGVEVAPWVATTEFPTPGDVVVEAFGCDPAPAFLAAMAAAGAHGRAPAWINLEYLSAEPYVERSHALASPQMSGPARGLTKWFFYPGFTEATGGLLREPGLPAARAAFDRADWLAAQGIALRPGERLVSMFCYAGAPVDRLVASLAARGLPVLLATAPGAATTAVAAALADGPATVRQHALPWLPQAGYDRLLWAADLNFVRGEDSWVRAHWADRPFIWQAYPQDDGAHAAKVAAFLDGALAAAAPAGAQAVRAWTAAWNGLDDPITPLPAWTPATLAAAAAATRAWRDRLGGSSDLVSRLLAFVAEKG